MGFPFECLLAFYCCVAGASPRGGTSIYDADLSLPIAIAVGNERAASTLSHLNNKTVDSTQYEIRVNSCRTICVLPDARLFTHDNAKSSATTVVTCEVNSTTLLSW